MPDTEQAETCTAKATIVIDEHFEADVECCLEVHDGKTHVARKGTHTTESTRASICYTWQA